MNLPGPADVVSRDEYDALRARLTTAEQERDQLLRENEEAQESRSRAWDRAQTLRDECDEAQAQATQLRREMDGLREMYAGRLVAAEARVSAAEAKVDWNEEHFPEEVRADRERRVQAEARVEALSEAARPFAEHAEQAGDRARLRAALACPPQQRGEK